MNPVKLTVLSSLLVTFVANFTFSQDGVILSVHPYVGQEELTTTGKFLHISESDSFRIDVLKFYVSDMALYHDSVRVWQENNSYHLMDLSRIESFLVHLKVDRSLVFDRIRFNIGIDSVTNSAGVGGADLDPVNGMYWTWQSGYINFKLEGVSNLCRSRKNVFQFHLGGYKNPYSALRTFNAIISGRSQIDVKMDIQKFMQEADLRKINHMMTTGKESAELSDKLLKIFSISE